MFNQLTELNESFEALGNKLLTARIAIRRLLTVFSMPKFISATDSLWFKIYNRSIR